MTTLLQLVLLLSVIIGIAGGTGMELRYIIMTVVLLKVTWIVVYWWRTFREQRDNRQLHRRLAYGSAIILVMSLSQLALTYLTDGSGDPPMDAEETLIAFEPKPAIPRRELPTMSTRSWQPIDFKCEKTASVFQTDLPLEE